MLSATNKNIMLSAVMMNDVIPSVVEPVELSTEILEKIGPNFFNQVSAT
jgi:hypothetical protein